MLGSIFDVEAKSGPGTCQANAKRPLKNKTYG